LPAQTRLAVVVSHPTQYYSPWFRWIRARTQVDLRVFYLWDFGVRPGRDPRFNTTFQWDVDLLSGYESEFVPNLAASPGAEGFFGFRNPLLPSKLSAWGPDAVLLFGYKWAAHLRAALWARLHGVPVLFRGDSHLLGRGAPRPAAALALRLLFSQFARFLYVGAANREYFEALGVPARKLFFAPHAVDQGLFDPCRRETIDAATALRARLGIAPGTRVLLYAGKFVAAKQPAELLRAFLSLPRADAALVFVGDGEERAALQECARAQDPASGNTVHFLPFANQSEMPALYLAADIFTLPSRGLYETWGLAVNEAMHMGLPCLVSDRVGCQRDLVTDGETGWVFRSIDPGHLRERMAAALTADLAPFKQRVAARIGGYTYRQTTEGLLAALGSLVP
jgi:glycosyltransferase involved in cell wall biosynthesis